MARMTKAASKVAAKTKSAAKALQGYPGIFRHLAAEHAELSILMKRVVNSPDDTNVREELFPEIRKNLLAHAHAEEEQFYPILFSFPELEPIVSQCAEEHQAVEECLIELEATDKREPAWIQTFEEMVKAIEVHVEREEKDLFPKAAELLTKDQAEDMDEGYSHAEEREKAQLHP